MNWLKKKDSTKYSEKLNVRVDSFVVETDVHYPTDVNLLFDAIRKTIMICARLSAERGWSDWRQHKHNVQSFKQKSHKLSKLKRSGARNQALRELKMLEIEQAHRTYTDEAASYLSRAYQTRTKLKAELATNFILAFELKELDRFIHHAERQIDQIRRRVLQGQTIPHEEKVFSIFEEYTEWISKGKAGVPVELGLKVAIVEDQHRFIVHHQVLQKTEDVQAAVPLIEETQKKGLEISSASFDKGFHSKDNQIALAKKIELVVMPKKGNLSDQDRIQQAQPDFVHFRKKHSAVESAINALGHHGLDRCLDHGLHGFERYVALAVLSRNILRLGQIKQQQVWDRRRHEYRLAA